MSSPEQPTKAGKSDPDESAGKAGKTEKKVDPASITGYLLAGMVLYGGLGWLADRWAGTENVFTPIGVIFGLLAGLFLTFRQISVLERQEREALTRAKRLERLDSQLAPRAKQDPQDPKQDPHHPQDQ